MKKKKLRKKRHNNIHHILPRSRGGSNDPCNLVMWDETFHDAYHRMFSNLTLGEAIEMLIIVSTVKKTWNKTALQELRNTLMED